jgi:hypothetical protein
MKIYSIYKSMEKSAELCPDGHNIKMLIRHSIRQDVRDDAGLEAIAQLTREEKKWLNVLENHSKYNHDIIETEMLQRPHCKNVQEEHSTWEKIGMNGIFDGFAKNTDMSGIYDLETSVNLMVNYLFETGNKNNSIDIFCTHDFQLAMLLLFLMEGIWNINKNYLMYYGETRNIPSDSCRLSLMVFFYYYF